MALVISVKNRDIANWRAAGEFAVKFREALLGQTANLLSDEVETLFLDVEKTLEQGAAAHDQALLRMREMIAVVSRTYDPAALRKMVNDFQAEILCFFNWNRSATAYFQLQTEFYEALAVAVVKNSREKAGLSDILGQPLALIALGDGGRGEFSLKGKLQFLLIHDDTMPLESVTLLGETLHTTFLECGVLPDDFLTPRRVPWRLTKKELIGRLINSMKGGSPKELQELIAIVDQRLLYTENDFGAELRDECLKLISDSHSAVLILVERLHALNSGIGLMGGVRLERSGPGRGKFRLCAYALQPLSYAVAALSLMKEETSFATPDRVRGLLSKGHLNVDAAERLLNAWHNFNEHRAVLEEQNHGDGVTIDELYLDYLTMEESTQDEFKYYLEATAALLRHVFITFNNWEESR